MAKTTVLRERGTNEVMYPQTFARLVRTDGGDNMEDALAKAKFALFDDMFRTAAGIYGDIDHSHIEDGVSKPYYLNKIWMTYEEAMLVYIHTAGKSAQHSASPHAGAKFSCAETEILTNIPPTYYANANYEYAFTGCRKIKVICLCPPNEIVWTIDMAVAFARCSKLEEIIGQFVCTKSAYAIAAFSENPELREFRLYWLKYSLDLRSSPLLSYDTFDYMITNARNSEPITITVHPDVYAKLTDENNVEWHRILADAALKNINFATT